MTHRQSVSFEEQITGCAQDARRLEITAEDIAAVRDLIIDTIGCAAGGFRSDTAQSVLRYLDRGAGARGASVWFSGETRHPIDAGFVNGVASRYLDFNDTYLGKIEGRHPSDVIPSLWALAETEGRSFEDLCRAVLLAYEVDCALADAISVSRAGVDNVFLGGIAASIAAGVLLGLEQTQMLSALRISACTLAPIKIRFGELSSWKAIAGPWAARCAVEAAYLARAGITGPPDVFEGKGGVWALLSVNADQARSGVHFPDASGKFALHRTSIKIYPTQFHTQSAVECAVRLHQKGIGVPRSVRVDTYQVAYETAVADPEKWEPKTRETADHSLPCCVALALAFGAINGLSFSEGARNQPQVAQIMTRMKVRVDPDMTTAYPALSPSRITVTTDDGKTEMEELQAPPGYANPASARATIHAKFMDLASTALGLARAEQMLSQLRELGRGDPVPTLRSSG